MVELGDDGIADALEFLLLVLEFVLLRSLVAVQPSDHLVALVLDLLLVVLLK